MSISDEKLMAFADGELDSAERAEIEQALAGDETLRARLAKHQGLRSQLSAAFDGALGESVPERLQPAAAPRGEVVDLAARRSAKPRWSAREWGAMAASIAAGLFIGIGVMGADRPLMVATEDGLAARGALARALDTQLAAEESDAVRIGLSFRDENGEYCRTFDLPDNDITGLACRNDNGWAVQMATEHEVGGEVRMAGASDAVLAAVEARIDGDILDAAAEAEARDAGWR